MVTVNFSALLEAFDFAIIGPISQVRAFVDPETGAIHFTSDEMELEDDVPEDLET